MDYMPLCSKADFVPDKKIVFTERLKKVKNGICISVGHKSFPEWNYGSGLIRASLLADSLRVLSSRKFRFPRKTNGKICQLLQAKLLFLECKTPFAHFRLYMIDKLDKIQFYYLKSNISLAFSKINTTMLKKGSDEYWLASLWLENFKKVARSTRAYGVLWLYITKKGVLQSILILSSMW